MRFGGIRGPLTCEYGTLKQSRPDSGLVFQVKVLKTCQGVPSLSGSDSIAASIYNKYSVGPSIRPICTRCCFTMTDVIQVSSNFHSALLFFINTRPDEIIGLVVGLPGLRFSLCLAVTCVQSHLGQGSFESGIMLARGYLG